jgi:hypothetical protein
VGENQPGLFALAVALKVPGCSPRFALVVSAPRVRLSEKALRANAAFLKRAGELLHDALEQQMPQEKGRPVRVASRGRTERLRPLRERKS